MARWHGKNGSVRVQIWNTINQAWDSYAVGDLDEWTLDVTTKTVETTALDDSFTQRVALDQDCRVTARKFQSTGGMALTEAAVVPTAGSPFIVELYSSPANGGLMQFQAPMYLESSRYSNPQGAIMEDVTFTLAGTPTVLTYDGVGRPMVVDI